MRTRAINSRHLSSRTMRVRVVFVENSESFRDFSVEVFLLQSEVPDVRATTHVIKSDPTDRGQQRVSSGYKAWSALTHPATSPSPKITWSIGTILCQPRCGRLGFGEQFRCHPKRAKKEGLGRARVKNAFRIPNGFRFSNDSLANLELYLQPHLKRHRDTVHQGGLVLPLASRLDRRPVQKRNRANHLNIGDIPL